MKNNFAPACPVSTELVDEHTIRIAAIITSIVVLLALYTNSYIIAALLAVDFFLRGFTNGKFSVIKQLSKFSSGKFNLTVKTTNAAPKKFAAKIGFVFAAIILLFQLLHLSTAAYIAGVTLIACALLEGLAGICIACLIYPIIFRD